MPVQTVPFQVVTGVAITPKQPFEHLYTHTKQRDPRLYETIERLAAPNSIKPNLANPLQDITYILTAPSPSSTTSWANVMSNVYNDMTLYYPIVAIANVDSPSSTDVKLDIQVSHDQGVNFTSVLNSDLIIPAGALVSPQLITFKQGAYFRNKDLSYMKLNSVAFDGGAITFNILFQ